MAIARTSPLLAAISGRVGSVVANNTRNGLVISARPGRRPPQSKYNAPPQNAIAAINSAWRDLADDDKLAWNRAGLNFNKVNRLGQSNPMSGFRMYHEFHAAQFWLYGVRNIPPPPPYRFPPFISLSLTFTFGGSYVVGGYGAFSTATDKVDIKVARSFSTSRPAHYRNWQVCDRIVYSQLPLDISGAPEYHFGENFADGEWVAVSVRTYDNLHMPSTWITGDTQMV